MLTSRNRHDDEPFGQTEFSFDTLAIYFHLPARKIEEEKAVKAIAHSEGTKRAFQTLKRYLKPNSTGSLTEIEVPGPNGTTEIITDPDSINDHIIKRDLRHYSQAEGTPFTRSPLKEFLGTSANTDQCEDFLNGADPPDDPSLMIET